MEIAFVLSKEDSTSKIVKFLVHGTEIVIHSVCIPQIKFVTPEFHFPLMAAAVKTVS
jgi:hypothetical protein